MLGRRVQLEIVLKCVLRKIGLKTVKRKFMAIFSNFSKTINLILAKKVERFMKKISFDCLPNIGEWIINLTAFNEKNLMKNWIFKASKVMCWSSFKEARLWQGEKSNYERTQLREELRSSDFSTNRVLLSTDGGRSFFERIFLQKVLNFFSKQIKF